MFDSLGKALTNSLAFLSRSENVNDETINAFLKNVATALIQADVDVAIVKKLRDAVKAKCEVDKSRRVSSSQLKRIVHQNLFRALIDILTPAQKPYVLHKGKPNVIMFVGLQGAGKTTTCTKYAHYLKMRGWRVALVCADTFRAGAFDQLKQNAAKIKVPFYGSYSILDPVEIAARGVQFFKKEKIDIIIVDTSGRHKQDAALFDEMISIESVIKPDEIIYVMDSHIGQACYGQAEAFKSAVKVASVIVTKLDGHAKGGGAVSAVVATGCAIAFLGTGEGFEALEPFDPKGFVSRLMGMGDTDRIMKAMEENMPNLKSKETAMRLAKGRLTYVDVLSQMKTINSLGSIGGMMSMIPGLSNLGLAAGMNQAGTNDQLKKFPVIIDSMTPEERNCEVELCKSRIERIARGSGSQVWEVEMLIAYHQMLSKMMAKMGKGMQNVQRMQKAGALPQSSRGMAHGAGGLPGNLPANFPF